MLLALVWGALAASSLVIGALLGVVRRWPERLIGAVLAFGAGALISAVSFDLAEEGVEVAGGIPVMIGLAVGALTYFLLDRALDRPRRPHELKGLGGATPARPTGGAGSALALGAFLDGIPEQLVLGIGIALDGEVGIGLLAAIFVSNLPEAVGSASAMHQAGRKPGPIIRLWVVVAVICACATLVGYAIADNIPPAFQGGANGFAAGALLVMLTDAMVPEARHRAGRPAGLLAVLGFAIAAGLSALG